MNDEHSSTRQNTREMQCPKVTFIVYFQGITTTTTKTTTKFNVHFRKCVHMWRHKRIMHIYLFEWFIRLAGLLRWKMANDSTIKINDFHLLLDYHLQFRPLSEMSKSIFPRPKIVSYITFLQAFWRLPFVYKLYLGMSVCHYFHLEHHQYWNRIARFKDWKVLIQLLEIYALIRGISYEKPKRGNFKPTKIQFSNANTCQCRHFPIFD